MSPSILISLIAIFLIYQFIAKFAPGQTEGRWSHGSWDATDNDQSSKGQPAYQLIYGERRPVDREELYATPPWDGSWTGWRQVRVAAVMDESPDCRSFRIESADQRGLPTFRSGQSILVGVVDPETGKRVSRCYSLSGGPGESFYRISVRRVPGGKVSNLLHDTVRPSDMLEIQMPQGRFVVDPSPCEQPLVLIAAGIGITPMVSMLLANLEDSPQRPVHLFYQLRSPENAPFLSLLRRVAKDAGRTLPVQLHVFFSQPSSEKQDTPAIETSDHQGRLNAERIQTIVGADAGEYMICGPKAFMSSVAEGLVDEGVASDRVHYESFGGGKGVGTMAVPAADAVDDSQAFDITVDSEDGPSKSATWKASTGSLLDAAEAAGVEMESACRVGDCGACRCKLRSGTVAYDFEPTAEIGSDEVLTCVARPTSDVAINQA